jgi:hypothetical protein
MSSNRPVGKKTPIGVAIGVKVKAPGKKDKGIGAAELATIRRGGK